MATLTTIRPATRPELMRVVRDTVDTQGPSCDLNHIDVSGIESFRGVFDGLPFNGDVSGWNMSNATRLDRMFRASPFNGDISQWDVSNVTNMDEMFQGSQFNGDISRWNVARVFNMENMFRDSPFSGDLALWNTCEVEMFDGMLSGTPFNRSVSSWHVVAHADITNVLPWRQLATIPASVFHWAMADEHLAQLSSEQRKHWRELRPVAEGMASSPEQIPFLMQALWCARHALLPALELPALDGLRDPW